MLVQNRAVTYSRHCAHTLHHTIFSAWASPGPCCSLPLADRSSTAGCAATWWVRQGNRFSWKKHFFKLRSFWTNQFPTWSGMEPHKQEGTLCFRLASATPTNTCETTARHRKPNSSNQLFCSLHPSVIVSHLARSLFDFARWQGSKCIDLVTDWN